MLGDSGCEEVEDGVGPAGGKLEEYSCGWAQYERTACSFGRWYVLPLSPSSGWYLKKGSCYELYRAQRRRGKLIRTIITKARFNGSLRPALEWQG